MDLIFEQNRVQSLVFFDDRVNRKLNLPFRFKAINTYKIIL